jgi:chromosome partitioning protein
MTQVIAFINQKGGVGKTSCCFHLAGALVNPVVLVDNDPQASLTQSLLGSMATRRLPPSSTVGEAYRREDDTPLNIMPIASGYLIPGCSTLFSINDYIDPQEITDGRFANFRRTIRSMLASITIIDCPPNIGGCAWAALAAADGVVIPVVADDLSMQGLAPVLEAVATARERLNPRLAFLGFVLTRYRGRQRLARSFREALTEAYPGDVFDAVIPDLAMFGEAMNAREPVTHYAPTSPAAAAIHAVALELLVRLEQSRSEIGEEVIG